MCANETRNGRVELKRKLNQNRRRRRNWKWGTVLFVPKFSISLPLGDTVIVKNIPRIWGKSCSSLMISMTSITNLRNLLKNELYILYIWTQFVENYNYPIITKDSSNALHISPPQNYWLMRNINQFTIIIPAKFMSSKLTIK